MARLAVCPSPTFFRIMTADFCFRLSFNLLLVTKRTNSTGAYEAEFNMATPLGKTVRIFVNALRLIHLCFQFAMAWPSESTKMVENCALPQANCPLCRLVDCLLRK